MLELIGGFLVYKFVCFSVSGTKPVLMTSLSFGLTIPSCVSSCSFLLAHKNQTKNSRIVPGFNLTNYMVDIDDEIPKVFDPFAEAEEFGVTGTKDYVHIRIQQRNGKKSVTTIQGLKQDLSYEKILKSFKKEFCCNGNVVNDKELGKIIQLQGDQRKNVSDFLVKARIAEKGHIKIHGF